MIPVSDALSACLDLCAPLETEEVPLAEAATRTLARAVTARRDQPPFASSAMDGYAVTEDDLIPGRSLRVVGEAAAGHHWAGRIGRGEAVRIFTGAPVPDGAAAVVIQEDVTRDGQRITLGRQLDDNRNIRAAGGDFRAGGDEIMMIDADVMAGIGLDDDVMAVLLDLAHGHGSHADPVFLGFDFPGDAIEHVSPSRLSKPA